MIDYIVTFDGIGLGLSAVLATVIGRRSVRAYNLTGRTYLLNFSLGFFCLAASYLLTIVLTFALYYPPPFGAEVIQSMLQSTSILPRLFVELLGFSLIASSYFTRERAGSVLLLALIAGAASLAIIASAVLEPIAGPTTTGLIRLLDTALMLYTLVQVSRSYTTKVVPGSFFVSWGFGVLTLSQYTWSIWSYSGTFLTAEISSVLRIVGLILLVYSLKR